jgi:hypothetical protein
MASNSEIANVLSEALGLAQLHRIRRREVEAGQTPSVLQSLAALHAEG